MRNLFLALITSCLVFGCVSFSPQSAPQKEAVFRGSMQQVWLAAEKVLQEYPIAESNVDTGILKTDYLRGDECFKSPNQTQKFSPGIRCMVTLQFAKVSKAGVRVRISKTIEIVRDFISEAEKLDDDGLEEMALLYRIDRELTVADEIDRATQESN
jgi:hypothetical protein